MDPFRTLYPDRREYTFIPSRVTDQNRSRLDFFLISSSLFTNNTKITIPHSLTSTLFDHKPVLLEICKNKSLNRTLIKDTILKSADLLGYIKTAVFEFYLQHWEPGPNKDGSVSAGDEIRNLLNTIGRISSLQQEIRELELKIAKEGLTELDDLTKSVCFLKNYQT